MDVVITVIAPPQEGFLARLKREYLGACLNETVSVEMALAVAQEPQEAIEEPAKPTYFQKWAQAEERAGVKLVKFFTE